MIGRNITVCDKRTEKCLGNNDCCYECRYMSWCDARCLNSACRREKVSERLGIKKGA